MRRVVEVRPDRRRERPSRSAICAIDRSAASRWWRRSWSRAASRTVDGS